jgi:hypothetical protein
MTKKEYNGWYNYETWLINLWMDNDEGSYNYWREQAQAVYDTAESDNNFTREERATLDLSERIKSAYEEAQPETAGLWADLLNAAMSEVNWHEIAEHLIADVNKGE